MSEANTIFLRWLLVKCIRHLALTQFEGGRSYDQLKRCAEHAFKLADALHNPLKILFNFYVIAGVH